MDPGIENTRKTLRERQKVRQGMTLTTAIKWLKRNYDLALKNNYVKDKVAWSLYLTWREVEQARSDKEYRDKHLAESEDKE
jgi:hypothetical protein